ncbi:hypothetical protein FDP41_012153 [Naegleria fowleri]|uniref:TOG domain-containing protein n=1 Tax=Naegleria fowleri TaxID=5763 RepID=A0A6A5C1F8_NAEFO|nr:uncharacterized protein FDP41_012153 [Naegleria fowleri]KAF0981496.1 hypothetical protein FDP41_012153 [Naegleria fowleri]
MSADEIPVKSSFHEDAIDNNNTEEEKDSTDLFMKMLEKKLMEEGQSLDSGFASSSSTTFASSNRKPLAPRKHKARTFAKKKELESTNVEDCSESVQTTTTTTTTTSNTNTTQIEDKSLPQPLHKPLPSYTLTLSQSLQDTTPVNVLGKISESWFTTIQEEKWSSKRDALSELKQLIDYPCLEDGDYSPIVARILAVIEEEKNLAVTKLVVECVELLSKGLKTNFSTYARELTEKLLPKMKDKKLSELVANAVSSVEESSLSFSELAPLLISSINSKSPFEKIGAVNCVEKCLSRKPGFDAIESLFNTLTDAVVQASEDSNKEVREASFKCLGRILWLVGERNFDPYFSKLDNIRIEKVKEFKSTFGASPAAHQPPQSKPSSSCSSQKSETKKQAEPPVKKAPPQKNPAVKRKQEETNTATNGPPSKKKTTSAKPSMASVDLGISCPISCEEALMRAEEVLPPSFLENMGTSQWKIRFEAMENLLTFISEMDKDTLNHNANVIILTLYQKPGWKDANAQVLNKLTEVAMYIMDNYHKNPKVVSEWLSWMSKTMEEFALQTIDVKAHIEFAKVCLGHSKPEVKKGATMCLCTMKRFMGEGLLNFLSDVKPATLDTIKKDFEKVQHDTPAATRFVRGSNKSSNIGMAVDSEEHSGAASSSGTTSFEDLLPRTDISGKLTAKLFKDMEDKAWKARLDALEEVKSIIIEANKRITPNINNLIQALKKRLEDANVKILSTTLELLVLIGEAVGSAMDKFTNAIIPYMITKLGHNNKGVRTDTYKTLEALIKYIPMESILKSMDKVLTNEKGHPDGRKDALQFIDTYMSDMKIKTRDTFQPIVKSIINSLQDPKACSRKLAESILEKMIQSTGADFVKENCKDLKPAFKSTILSVISKYENIVPSTSSLNSFQETPLNMESVNGQVEATKSSTTVQATSKSTSQQTAMTIGDIKRQQTQQTQQTQVRQTIGQLKEPSSCSQEEEKNSSASRRTLTQASLFPSAPSNNPLRSFSGQESPTRSSSLQDNAPSTPGKRNFNQVKDSVFTTPKKMKFTQAPTDQLLLLSPTNLLTPRRVQTIIPERKELKLSVEQVISLLSNTKISNFENAMNAMKALDKLVEAQDMGIAMNREALLYALTNFFEVVFDSVIIGLSGPRICKIIINTLMGLFEARPFSVAVTKKSLYHLLDTLLRLLLNEKLPYIEYGDKMMSALNSLILKILENSSRTTAYGCLISMLEKSCLDHEQEPSTLTRVLIKCLNKLTKTLEKTIGIIDINTVLLDVQHFMTNNPQTFFEGKDDSPFITIKTIIQTLVRLKGATLRAHMNGLNKVMIAHIEHELNVISISNSSITSTSSRVIGSPVRSTQQQSDSELLKEICTMIGNKETNKSGLYKLYHFQVQHPEFKLSEFLATTQFGKIFQDYIVKSIAKIAGHEQAKSQQKTATGSEYPSSSSVSTSTLSSSSLTPPESTRPALKDLTPSLSVINSISSASAIASIVENSVSTNSNNNNVSSKPHHSLTSESMSKMKFSIDDYRKELKLRSSSAHASLSSSASLATSSTLSLSSSLANVQSIKERLAQVKVNSASSIDLESIRQKYKQQLSSTSLNTSNANKEKENIPMQ